MRFAGGIAVPVLGLFVVVPVAGAVGGLTGGSVGSLAGLMAFAGAAGGALAGSALGRGWRGAAAFALAFPVGLALPLLAVASVPALSGRERLVELVAGFVPAFAASFGLMGGVGTALVGAGWRRALQSSLAFSLAGVIGGLALTAVATFLPGGLTGRFPGLFVIAAALTPIVPAALAGWWLVWSSSATRVSPPSQGR